MLCVALIIIILLYPCPGPSLPSQPGYSCFIISYHPPWESAAGVESAQDKSAGTESAQDISKDDQQSTKIFNDSDGNMYDFPAFLDTENS